MKQDKLWGDLHDVSLSPTFEMNQANSKNTSDFLRSLWFIKDLVKQATGFDWKDTSYIRDSASHQYGISLDIAPNVNPSDKQHYAFYNQSDPVLHRRPELYSRLLSLNNLLARTRLARGMYGYIFIENDHLHLMLWPNSMLANSHVVLYGSPKWVYPDTIVRMNMQIPQQWKAS